MPRRPRKSRRNPFVRGKAAKDSKGMEVYEFYTRDEIDRLLTAMVAEQSAPVEPPRSRSRAAERPAARQTGRRKEKRKPQPNDPLDWKQAQVLGLTLGSMKRWCPNVEKMRQTARAAGKDLTRRDAFTAMGITYGVASAILDELSTLPIPDEGDPDRQKTLDMRREVVLEMLTDAGFSCEVKQPKKKKASSDFQASLARIANLDAFK